jgi:hypothetical protein
MRGFRPVAPAEAAAADPPAAVVNVPNDSASAMRELAAAAHIVRFGVAPRTRPASATVPAQVSRFNVSGLTAMPPLHRPTVTGAGASHPGDHVGGAMLPPPVNTVALSDGTRISFSAVGEVPVLESV